MRVRAGYGARPACHGTAGLLLAGLVLGILASPAAAVVNVRAMLRASESCDPLVVAPADRCAYVRRTDACEPDGLVNYLDIYYCTSLHKYPPLAGLAFVAGLTVLFVLMFTACDRFFCPAMELLSEYLRLSPAVAGATLLALGNGAPDVFSQIAAARSGAVEGGGMTPESLSMALSEPLGTGLFVGNVVVALLIWLGRGVSQDLTLRPIYFLKDLAFYLAAVGIVFSCMLAGRAYLWQCVLLMVSWVVYISWTIYLSQKEGENSVALDPLQHEIPRLVPYGPWDDLDSDCLEDWDWLDALPDDMDAIPPTPGFPDATADITARLIMTPKLPPPGASGRSGTAGVPNTPSSAYTRPQPGWLAELRTQQQHVLPGTPRLRAAGAGTPRLHVEAGTPRAYQARKARLDNFAQALMAPVPEAVVDGLMEKGLLLGSATPRLMKRPSLQVRAALPTPAAAAAPPVGGPTRRQARSLVSLVRNTLAGLGGKAEKQVAPLPTKEGSGNLDEQLYVPLLLGGRLDELNAALSEQGSQTLASVAEADTPGAGTAEAPEPSPAARLGEAELAAEQKRLKKLLYFGHQQAQQRQQGEAGGGSGAPPPAMPPVADRAPASAGSNGDLREPLLAPKRPPALMIGGSGDGDGGEGGDGDGNGLILDEAVIAEQAALNALVAAEVAQRAARHAQSRESVLWLLWRIARRPIVLILSLTMPMIEHTQELKYDKFLAVLLPLFGPGLGAMYMGWWTPFAEAGVDADSDAWSPQALHIAGALCVLASLAAIMFWPSDGVLHGWVLGACTLLTFFGSMVWMNVAADELVGLLSVAGKLLRLPPGALGATLLAWGNSSSDTVANATMARDGYPTMAITACFASPLFILLAGVACTLSAGAVDGPLIMPQDLPTISLYGASIVSLTMWATAVPLWFKFRLDMRAAAMAVTFYVVFQAVYVVIITRH